MCFKWIFATETADIGRCQPYFIKLSCKELKFKCFISNIAHAAQTEVLEAVTVKIK